ncbi:unnamed protein product [Lampetra fluviatilis]
MGKITLLWATRLDACSQRNLVVCEPRNPSRRLSVAKARPPYLRPAARERRSPTARRVGSSEGRPQPHCPSLGHGDGGPIFGTAHVRKATVHAITPQLADWQGKVLGTTSLFRDVRPAYSSRSKCNSAEVAAPGESCPIAEAPLGSGGTSDQNAGGAPP